MRGAELIKEFELKKKEFENEFREGERELVPENKGPCGDL